jgi:hypothetical protein
VFSKRNAIIGWLVVTLAKPLAKRKARQAARKAMPGKRSGIIAGSVAAVGATLAGLMFWRRRKKDEESLQT